mgnify:CR=1 FL=1
MEFYRNFLFEYSLTGIVKPKFTRRNEIWCIIWKIEDLSKNVHKKQDRTPLMYIGTTQYWIYRNQQFLISFIIVCIPNKGYVIVTSYNAYSVNKVLT